MQFESESALDTHLKSKAHREFYCTLHDTLFKSNSKLEEHLKSSAHQFRCLDHNLIFRSKIELVIHFKTNHSIFSCEEHSQIFDNPESLTDHMCSSAHVTQNSNELFDDQQVLKKMSLLALNDDLYFSDNFFNCHQHQKSFKNQMDLDNHLNSIAHLEDLSIGKINKLLYNSTGKWILTQNFSFSDCTTGYFKCSCLRWWISSFSFKNYKQACQKCEKFNYPLFLVEYSSNKVKSGFKGKKIHDELRCEACSLGLCI